MPSQQHGGNLDAVARSTGIPKEAIIDFSGNINPLGPPKSATEAIIQQAGHIDIYPDAAYVHLKAAIAAFTGAMPEQVLVGNGATELIALFIQAFMKNVNTKKKAVILSPAYSEYEREVSLLGLAYTLFPLTFGEQFSLNVPALLHTLDDTVGIFIITSPNNPTGFAPDAQSLLTILTHCQSMGIAVMVDETYVEFASTAISAVPFLNEFPNLFIVRGTSKFFASPGLRLGYGLCGSPELSETITKAQYPWSVSLLADAAGQVMFLDQEYIEKTKTLITNERQKLMAALTAIPTVHPFASQANFILVKLLEGCPYNSAEIAAHMLQHCMLIRDCQSFSYLDDQYIRFCILKPEENQRLLTVLTPLLKRKV